MGGEPDQRHARDQTQPGGDQRHPSRSQRSERQQQDDQRCQHPDLSRRADTEPLSVLDHLTARRHLKTGHVNGRHLRQQRLARRVRQHVRGLVVVDRRERRHPVRRNLNRAPRAIGADDPRDMRQRADPRQQRRDRRPHRWRVDRPTRNMKHDRVGIAALSLEIPLEQVKRPLRLGARQTERGHVSRPHGMRHHGRENRQRHPRNHHAPTMGYTPAGNATHRYLPSEQQRETSSNAPLPIPGKSVLDGPDDLAATECPRVLAPL